MHARECETPPIARTPRGTGNIVPRHRVRFAARRKSHADFAFGRRAECGGRGASRGGFFKIVAVARQLHHQRLIAAAAAAVLRQQVVAAPAKAPPPRQPPRRHRSRARATARFLSVRPVVFSFSFPMIKYTNTILSLPIIDFYFFTDVFPNP